MCLRRAAEKYIAGAKAPADRTAQRLALTSSTSGSSSVDIVRSQTKATELFYYYSYMKRATLQFNFSTFPSYRILHNAKEYNVSETQ
jgi:hypothetical protein